MKIFGRQPGVPGRLQDIRPIGSAGLPDHEGGPSTRASISGNSEPLFFFSRALNTRVASLFAGL